MKNNNFSLGVLLFFLIPFSAYSASEHSHKSKYVGQEKREIKSLSESDIEELEKGKGWGFAKAAELNGVPGPIHLLEMKKEIRLNSEQIQKIEDIYQEMKKQAIPLGLELVELERRLNNHFANRTITDNLLHKLLGEIVQVRKKLRYAHLSAHLKTPDILTFEQITLYNELRGYSSKDPCKNIPEGHDPEMWKKHHNCQ
jgi:Spy/CpxP family protein refolding chaperone